MSYIGFPHYGSGAALRLVGESRLDIGISKTNLDLLVVEENLDMEPEPVAADFLDADGDSLDITNGDVEIDL